MALVRSLLRDLAHLKMSCANSHDRIPTVPSPCSPFACTRIIDESRFNDVNKIKLLKVLVAAGVICGIHTLVSLQLNNEILVGRASI